MKYLLIFVCAFSYASSVFAQQKDPYAEVRPQIESCATCHGAKGAIPILPEYPILAGQHMYYLYVQLKDFKSGRRENAIMQPLAAALEKDEMKLIATYFSEQQWPGRDRQLGPGDENSVQAIINSGQCPACHLGGFEGNSRVPWTRAQNQQYLLKTLLDFKYRRRKNAPDKGILMETFDDKDLERLATYLSSLPIEHNQVETEPN